jgi:separase
LYHIAFGFNIGCFARPTLLRTFSFSVMVTLGGLLRLSLQRTDPDLLTEALDTLFLLARTSLDPRDAQTYGRAFDFLARATELLRLREGKDVCEPASNTKTESQANLVRCVSGAFYNLAGTLYQESRYGAAVRFLKQGCELGGQALSIYHQGEASMEPVEHWTALKNQMYRRWELLGVCYAKIGDRKVG